MRITMESLDKCLIIHLQNHFYKIITQDASLFKYEIILDQMLETIQQLLKAEEISLYTYFEWKQQYVLEATTIPKNKAPSEIPSEIIDSIASDKSLTHKDNLPKELNHYDIVIPFHHLGQSYLFIKGKSNQFSELSQSTFEKLGAECGAFIRKVQDIIKLIFEEKRYKQLFKVTGKVHSMMNMESVLGEIVSTLREIYPTFTYFLFLSQDYKGYEGLPIKTLDFNDQNHAIMQSYLTGTIQLEDSVKDKKSILYAPLKGKQGVYGVLQVIAPNTLVFPKNETEFISVLANTAGAAMENAKLYEQSRRLIADLQLINETSHRLNSNLSLAETVEYVSKQIVSSLGAEEVGIIQFNHEDGTINKLPGTTEFFYRSEAEKYIRYFKEKISKENDAMFIGDCKIPFQVQPEFKYKSIMAVPMMQSDVINGFVLVLHHKSYAFSFETFKLFRSLIHHSTLAFTNTILREELEKMVITDHLTKLYSRSYLDEKIKQSMAEDGEGTFIMIDIDDFKQINDTYGHQVGDDVIIQVANIIQSHIRGSDIGARWGGEELAIYLPRVPIERGNQIAERLVKKVKELSHPTVTISCGISYWKKDENDCYQSLFKRADKALYEAKGSGKDRVVVHHTKE